PTRALRHSQPANLSAADAHTKEYKVKAALLYNFLKYARFPDGTFPKKSAPVTILVVGKNPFGPILEKVLGKKKAGGRPFKFESTESIPKGEIKAQLVFASGLDEGAQQQLVKKLAKKPVLLVGEMDGFAERGGFINLYLEKGKVRFAINTNCQKSTGIQLKAELLKLAKLVKSKKDTSGGGR
ncbi:MAG: YfiR family protein, partial [Planctomycetota bacterium]